MDLVLSYQTEVLSYYKVYLLVDQKFRTEEQNRRAELKN